MALILVSMPDNLNILLPSLNIKSSSMAFATEEFMKVTSSALNSLILGREEFSFVPSRPTKDEDIIKEIDLLETADDDKPGCIVLAKGLDVLAADTLNLRFD
jgi:hypothetical protein